MTKMPNGAPRKGDQEGAADRTTRPLIIAPPPDGECGCCASGARRAALDRLKAQADQRRIATALCRLIGYRRAA
jgi:hypothetical protein